MCQAQWPTANPGMGYPIPCRVMIQGHPAPRVDCEGQWGEECGRQSGPFLGYLLVPQEGTSLALPEASVSWTQLTWTLIPNAKKEQL